MKTFMQVKKFKIISDHSLGLPLISVWNPQTEEYDILKAIEEIFHKPNWGEGENPGFSAKS
mgnify:CR=1 FL=1